MGVIGCLVLGTWLLAAAPAAEQTQTGPADVVVERAREILGEDAYQTELPRMEPANIRLPFGLGAFATILMFVLGAAVLILVAFWIVNEFFLGGAADAGDAGDGSVADAGSDEQSLLADPERLAGERRYEEAIHMLLLIAIRHLGRALPKPPSQSATSRELLRTLPLARDGRQAFGELVRQVELSLFGGLPAGADQYERCRSCFRTLLAGAAA